MDGSNVAPVAASKAVNEQLDTLLNRTEVIATPWKTTALAASVESFYRSALNALINRRLTGAKLPFFPSMHVQLPTRVTYITGFKGARAAVDRAIRPEDYPVHQRKAVALTAACLPGVFMTPVSSVLEACNASSCPTPLYRRWLHGITARMNREVIFGIGLNQLTDHFESKMPDRWSPAVQNAAACIGAGVVAGYLSHVPHNLSTLKLLNPSLSYGHHMNTLAGYWRSNLGFISNARVQNAAAVALAIVAPRGLLIRTTQVVGSFIILNGIISAFKDSIDFSHED